jgi:hypothetical protein
MAEEQKNKNVEDLLKQISDFEKTIQSLAGNVSKLKDRLLVNKEKYGPDMGHWPKEEK